jgi:hypothetical protein
MRKCENASADEKEFSISVPIKALCFLAGIGFGRRKEFRSRAKNARLGEKTFGVEALRRFREKERACLNYLTRFGARMGTARVAWRLRTHLGRCRPTLGATT